MENLFLFKEKLTRREFLKNSCLFCLGGALSYCLLDRFLQTKALAGDSVYFHEASYYKKINGQTVQCELCPRSCTLSGGQRSFCRAREPKDGKLYSLVYARACAVHIDPIEKKPLFHFLPGTPIFSIATAGCNFRCKYCQNWQISQFGPDKTHNEELRPQEIVNQTLKNRVSEVPSKQSESGDIE